MACSTLLLAQTPTNNQQGTVFRTTTNFVSTDVIVRDRDGRFVPDLKAADFRVYEDGVPQNITLFTPWIGGRALGNLASSTATALGRVPATEGLILPTVKQRADTSGRLFIIFIDDLHMVPADTPRMKDLLKRVRDILVHDNDLVGFVSTGTSSIEIDPSYDYGHRRFNEAIEKVMGSMSTADEIIGNATFEGSQGPQGLRFNTHTAFKTAYGMLEQMSAITERRKAFVWVSSGYNFNPFSDSRLKRIQDSYAETDQTVDSPDDDDKLTEEASLRQEAYNKRTEFSNADLTNELAQLIRDAQRANVVFYTIDPRGLIATGSDASTRTQISYADWRDYFQTQNNSLMSLAIETGGFATVQTNDFDKNIRRIDSETSDFYQLGYTSSNPDPTKIRRVIKIEIARDGVQDPIYRSEYNIPKTKLK